MPLNPASVSRLCGHAYVNEPRLYFSARHTEPLSRMESVRRSANKYLDATKHLLNDLSRSARSIESIEFGQIP